MKMDQPLVTLYTCIIATLFSIISSPPFTHGYNLNFTSVANLSSSWINTPTKSVFVNSTLLPILSITPILFSTTNYTNFVCGFFCGRNESANLFGVLLYISNKPITDTVNEPQLIWSANRDHPININATLKFTSEGDIVLKDADESLVWSTSTRDKNISRLELTEIGNLVLYNKADKIVWQSFDHPTDTLLLGQSLVKGQKLTSSISTSNWSQGQYSVYIQNRLLVSSMNSNPPQKYYQTDNLVYEAIVMFDGTSFKSTLDPQDAAGQFMRLEPDGHMKSYQWTSSYSLSGTDVLTSSWGECGYPLVCGRYGICSNGQCTCPEEAENETSSFRQLIYRQPNLGCAPITPISCNHSHLHSLLELKNTTYFNLNRESFSTMRIPEVDEELNLEDCKSKCLRDCSYKGVAY